MGQKIRIGVIGAGGIAAKLHFPELAQYPERGEVTWICGRRESRLKKQCELFNIPNWTTDFAKVATSPEVDGVIIATPHPQHVSWGVMAIQAGKHVMMQKPLSGDMDEANQFVKAVEASDRTVLCLPHYPASVYAVNASVADGLIGELSGGRARTSHGGPEVYYAGIQKTLGEEPEKDLWFFDSKRASVGALFDMGVYAVSHLIAMLGSVKRVMAMTASLHKPTDLEDTASLLLEFESGVIATAETSWADPGRTWEWSIHGTTGKFSMNGPGGKGLVHTAPSTYESDSAPSVSKEVDTAGHGVGDVHKHWFDCIDKGIQPPLSNAWAARHVTEVLLAALEAAKKQAPVDIASSVDPPATVRTS